MIKEVYHYPGLRAGRDPHLRQSIQSFEHRAGLSAKAGAWPNLELGPHFPSAQSRVQRAFRAFRKVFRLLLRSSVMESHRFSSFIVYFSSFDPLSVCSLAFGSSAWPCSLLVAADFPESGASLPGLATLTPDEPTPVYFQEGVFPSKSGLIPHSTPTFSSIKYTPPQKKKKHKKQQQQQLR